MDPKSDFRQVTYVKSASEAAELLQKFEFCEFSYDLKPAMGDQVFDEFDEFLKYYVSIELDEDRVRYGLAHGERLQSDWEHCVTFFDNIEATPRLQPEREAVYFAQKTIAGTASRAEFEGNFKEFTCGIFEGIDMSNFVVSGGAVLSCLLPGCRRECLSEDAKSKLSSDLLEQAEHMDVQVEKYPTFSGMNGFYTSDIDLFVYGLSPENAAKRVDALVRALSAKSGYDIVSESKQAITLLGHDGRDIEVVFRLYDKPAEIVLGFDIDCAAVAYDFKDVYATRRSLFAIANRVNVVNQKRRSTSYASRLIKYGKRGFQVCIPGFSRQFLSVSKIPSAAVRASASEQKLHMRTKNEQLLLEHIANGGEQCANLLPEGEINQIIAADLATTTYVSDFGIDSALYQYEIKQIVIIAANTAVENRLENAFLTEHRRLQTATNKSVKNSNAANCSVVEADEITENQLVSLHERVDKYDVLSYQFSAKSDYCQPTSFGFHSDSALRYRRENPKFLLNLYVGPYRPDTPIYFVTKNPGKEDLFTSSFHPDASFGYYGDLRLFVGAHIFDKDFVPQTSVSLQEKLFFLNHFCSLPAGLVSGYEKGRIERMKFEEFQKMRKQAEDILQSAQIDEQSLFDVLDSFRKCQLSIADCISACEQREILAAQPLEIGDNYRQLFRWTWYVDPQNIDLASVDDVQAVLFKNMISDIELCKVEGNNISEYLEAQREVDAAVKQLESQLEAVYTQLREHEVATCTLAGRTIELRNERSAQIFQALNELELADKLELGLFDTRCESLISAYDDATQRLKVCFTADLHDLEEARAMLHCRLSASALQMAQITLSYDMWWLQVKIALSSVQPFEDVVRETASYDSLCVLYRQFSDITANYEVPPAEPQIYVYQGRLLYVNAMESVGERLEVTQIDSYLAENLGVGRNYVECVKAMQNEQTAQTEQVIEVPLRLIRELQCRKNREFYSELEIAIPSAELQDKLMAFRILKSTHQELILKLGGKELPTYQFVHELVEQLPINAKLPHSTLFLLGKMIAYALQNSISLPLSYMPMCFFRALLLEAVPSYSKYNADAARYDLAASDVDFRAVQSSDVNGFNMTRERLGDDGFDALLANQFAAEWKKVIECVVDGFVSLGGCGGYAEYNACQLKTIICGK